MYLIFGVVTNKPSTIMLCIYSYHLLYVLINNVEDIAHTEDSSKEEGDESEIKYVVESSDIDHIIMKKTQMRKVQKGVEILLLTLL